MRNGFTLVEILVVILILGILMALLIPTVIHALCLGRETAAQELMSNVTVALKMYWKDYNTFPAGDGTGSKDMIAAITKTGLRKGTSYLEEKVQLDTLGNLNSPVDPDHIFYYRYPGTHNKSSYDLWCKNCLGTDEGVNNWGEDKAASGTGTGP